MDEAKRFLRYVIPGLVFFTQTLLLLSVIESNVTRTILEWFNKASGVGLVIATILASGGVGYMLSVVHHQFHWWDRFGARAVDHRDFITSLRRRRIIRLMKRDSGEELAESETIDRFQAWTIFVGLWHERLSEDSLVKSADPRSSSLADLVHSLGTARVAALAAFIVALAILWKTCAPSAESEAIAHGAVGTVWGVLFVILCEIGYRRTGRGAQRFVEQVLDDALTKEQANNGTLIDTYVAA